MSAFEVDAVVATAAGSVGLRAGAAVCWRAAGARGGVVAGAAAIAPDFAVSFWFSLAPAPTDLGTAALCAIGRGFGRGILAFAQASAASPDNPTASATATTIIRAVDDAVDRNRAIRVKGSKAVFRKPNQINA